MRFSTTPKPVKSRAGLKEETEYTEMKMHLDREIKDGQDKYNLLVNTEFGYFFTPTPKPYPHPFGHNPYSISFLISLT